MKVFSPKRSKKTDARQAERDARKAAACAIAPERIAAVHLLPNGQEVVELKPVHIPGYTYAF